MMKKMTKAMKKTFSIFILAVACFAAYAQEPMRTAYFLDAYNFRHQMNPAFASARSYFALPALGYTSVGVQSNLGVKTFLYPSANGQLATFMDNSVSRDTFLGQLHRNNIIAADVSTSLLSIGAWGKRNGFTTVELNLKSNVSVNLPRDLFAFMKNPGADQHYDISHMGARAKAYLEFSLGHSQRINERISVGAKLKFLMGAANARADINSMTVDMTAQEWRVNANGSLYASCGALMNIPTYAEAGEVPEGKQPDMLDFNSITFDVERAFSERGISAFLGGYGAAIDLGASWEIIKGLTVSAAVLDLGFICWNNATYAETDNTPWTFTGFEEFSFDEESDNSIGNQFGHVFDGMEDFIAFQKKGSRGYTEMLAATVNAGVQYKMPFWDSMSVGALLTSRIQGEHSWTEGRLSVNFAFGNVFALSGSYAYSNFGSTFGAAMNLHCRAVSFYLGTDTIPTHFTAPLIENGPVKIGLPLNKMNIGLNFGLVFNVSKRKDKLYR